MIGARFRRRLVSTALVIGGASAALAMAGPDARVPFKDAAGAAATVGVAFVIDFGTTAAPVVGCVKVPPSDNGYLALQAFTQQEHLAPPVFNSAGLLCSIDDDPPDTPAVCGQSVSGGYQFWSYWYMTNGSGQWTYADRGASAAVGSAANGQDVEGWRFQNPGPDNSSAPAPRTPPDYASICASALAAPNTTTTTTAVHAAPTAPPTTPPPTTAVVPTTTPTTRPTPTTAPSTTSTTSTTMAPSVPITSVPSGGKGQALGATPTSADHPGGGSAVPLLVGGLLVLVLAAGAAIGWRRRSGAP